MKALIKKILIGAIALSCLFTLTACTPSDAGEGSLSNSGEGSLSNSGERSLAEQQLTLAQSTYNSFYNKNGGLFSEQPQSKAMAVMAARSDNSGISFDAVREVLQNYKVSGANIVKPTFNSYVADIFSYSQVQTSIIDEFGEASLTDVYVLNYDNVDWDSDTSHFGNWIKSTKLLSASFAGTDLANGNVYCTQAHISSSKTLALANLEYYYNSDGDMGVTTLNWHSDNRFEYHYCSAGTYEILQAYGTYNDDGIILSSIRYFCQNGLMSGTVLSETELQTVFSYVQFEISRINGKIDELQEMNNRKHTLDGTEETEGEHVGICSVKFDFSVLEKMLIK